jgi:hypothetical protein
MKKLCLLLSFISVLSFGQDHYIGFSGGYSYSSANILSGTSGTMDPQHMYFGGINYQFHPEKWFYINLGVRYDLKGFGLNNETVMNTMNDVSIATDTSANYNYQFHNVSVPFKLGFKLGGKVFFLMAVGVIPSYVVHANATTSLNYQGNEISTMNQTTWTNIKRFDLPVVGEIGFGAHLGENVLMTFTASYTQSFTKHLMPTTSYESGVQIESFKTVRHKGIHGELGLMFRLHKKKKKLQKYNSSN